MLERRPLRISASSGLTFDSTISRVECQSEESKATSQSVGFDSWRLAFV